MVMIFHMDLLSSQKESKTRKIYMQMSSFLRNEKGSSDLVLEGHREAQVPGE